MCVDLPPVKTLLRLLLKSIPLHLYLACNLDFSCKIHSSCKPLNHFYEEPIRFTGWLGWAMVLGSFQCRGVMLLLQLVGQGPTVLAAGAGWVGSIFHCIFHLSSLSNVLSFGRQLNMTEILWFRLLNPNG